MPFENALFQLAQMFLWPVTLLVFATFAYAVMSLGAFGLEWFRRRQQPGCVLVLSGANARSPETLELAVLKELEGLRLCSRVAPMLGLVATMIPMGPALVAVGSIYCRQQNSSGRVLMCWSASPVRTATNFRW